MIKAVVFDWNGTLIADTQACMEADSHVLKACGGTAVGLTTYRDTMVIPAIDFYTQHGCNREDMIKNAEKYSNIFHNYYEKRVNTCRTRTGAREVLSLLQKNSIRSTILSNHTVEGIETQLKRLGLRSYIDEVLANDTGVTSMKKRNKTKKLHEYIKKYQYTSRDAIIIGDSPEEVEMGRSAGIVTVAITGGYYSTKRLKHAKPDYLIGNLKELMGIIKK